MDGTRCVENGCHVYRLLQMKILVLILSSEHEPIYVKLKQIWKLYMNKCPETFECYFYEENPDLETEAELHGNVLYVKCPFGVENTTYKLQKALRFFEPRFHEFDFIFRTNLSSFVIWETLQRHIEQLPKKRVCTSVDSRQVAGAGFTMSMDVATDYMNLTEECLPLNDVDDITMNKLVRLRGYETPKCHRSIIHYTSQWPTTTKQELDYVCYIRVKHLTESREIYDIQFMNGLLAAFYPD